MLGDDEQVGSSYGLGCQSGAAYGFSGGDEGVVMVSDSTTSPVCTCNAWHLSDTKTSTTALGG
jgi:hypothetical protein